MKRIYFIRHAPTIVNQTGEMVKDYKHVNIQPLTDDEINIWNNRVGKYIKSFDHVYISDTTRTHETSQLLLKPTETIINEDLNEINCLSLGDEKFWEISEDRFNELVHVDLEEFDAKVKALINKLLNVDASHNIVCVTHGLYIRHLYHLLTSNKADTLYKQINSVDFKFNPLDMLEVDYVCKYKTMDKYNMEYEFNEYSNIQVYRYKN